MVFSFFVFQKANIRGLAVGWVRMSHRILICVLFNVHGSVHLKNIPIYIQQDATLHISGNWSTCFGWQLIPSSGAHTTVSTASGICQNVTATCRQRQVAVTVLQITDAVDIVVCAPDDGWRYHPKHVEQFPDINKLCKVASCWIYIGIYLRFTDP